MSALQTVYLQQQLYISVQYIQHMVQLLQAGDLNFAIHILYKI
jgi:hypothetical protein